MYHVAFTPDYAPSNAFSAKADTLTGALAELLQSMATLDCEHWYLSFVLVTMHEAVSALDDNKTAKSSWSDMGSPDDAFSIDIFTEHIDADDVELLEAAGVDPGEGYDEDWEQSLGRLPTISDRHYRGQEGRNAY